MDNFREWLSDNLRYIILGAGIIIIVLAVFFGIRALSGAFGSGNTTTTNKDAQAEVSEDVQDTPTETPDKEDITEPASTDTTLQSTVDEKVSALLNKYYVAMGNKDIDTVKTCVDTLSAEDEKLITNPQYIEGYSDIVPYAVAGNEEGSYVTYVQYNIKLKNIDTLYPAINQNYVSTDSSGNLYIVTEALSEEQQTYVSSVTAQEDVQQLVSSVETAEQAAQDSDAALRNFIKELGVSSSTAIDAADGSKVRAVASCNVRKSASEDGEALGMLTSGDEVTKTGNEGDWVQVDYNGQTGYVRGDLLEAVS